MLIVLCALNCEHKDPNYFGIHNLSGAVSDNYIQNITGKVKIFVLTLSYEVFNRKADAFYSIISQNEVGVSDQFW